ncbi:MAG: CpsB/CapC family capsule biosynthesis tyrosine phosphatase [Flavobacteriaceae bacterium]
MFSFFEKKIFLVDHIEGLIDIHNHILPGIDDGAKTVEDSIALIKEFSAFGVTNFICTPHIMNNYYPNTPETIGTAFNILQKKLDAEGMSNIYIDKAAEHMIDDNFETILENDKVMPLKNFYLLVEMSFLQPSINFEKAISKIVSKNFFPILAHPERYVYFHKNFYKYSGFKKNGILFQTNLLSLSNYYGPEIKKITHRLIDKKHIDFVGSDIHNLNQLNHLKNTTISRKVLDKLNPIIASTVQRFS